MLCVIHKMRCPIAPQFNRAKVLNWECQPCPLYGRFHNSETDVVHGLYGFIGGAVSTSRRKFTPCHPRTAPDYLASTVNRPLRIHRRGMFVSFRVEPITAPFVGIPSHIVAAVHTNGIWVIPNGCEPLDTAFRGVGFGRFPLIAPRVFAPISTSG